MYHCQPTGVLYHITAAVRHLMSYHYNVYLLCYSRHVKHSSHVQSILAIVWPILVCQDIVAGQQRILIISSEPDIHKLKDQVSSRNNDTLLIIQYCATFLFCQK